jgi:hypothetical protein
VTQISTVVGVVGAGVGGLAAAPSTEDPDAGGEAVDRGCESIGLGRYATYDQPSIASISADAESLSGSTARGIAAGTRRDRHGIDQHVASTNMASTTVNMASARAPNL